MEQIHSGVQMEKWEKNVTAKFVWAFNSTVKGLNKNALFILDSPLCPSHLKLNLFTRDMSGTEFKIKKKTEF